MQIQTGKQEAQGRGRDPKDNKMLMHPSPCHLQQAVEISLIKCLMEDLLIQDL
jgi:hypothetical protein